LLLVVALVGTAPFWGPLLPWSERPGIDPAIAERLDAQQRQIRSLQQQIAAETETTPKLEQRIGALEQQPQTPPPELDEVRRQLAAVSAGGAELTSRLEHLGSSTEAQAAAVADLKSRLDRAEQAEQERIAGLAARLDPLQQSLQAREAVIAELRSRVQTLEKTARSRSGDLTDIGLMLTLSQIRDAVDAGRPFPAEYDAFSSLAKARPEIAAAAAPLGPAASTGAVTSAALARELGALGQKIDAAEAPTAASSGAWTDAALARLRALVRIRRADEAEPSQYAEAILKTAERALAGGDLARAVAEVETLPGPAAASASDWLRQARERIAVETALRQLQAMLAGRLGGTAAIPGQPG
jgi:hypothetical protein